MTCANLFKDFFISVKTLTQGAPAAPWIKILPKGEKMYIFECKTQNGRIFRVAIANNSQKKRFLKLIQENEKKSYEKFTSIKDVLSGIHDIKQFEMLCSKLN